MTLIWPWFLFLAALECVKLSRAALICQRCPVPHFPKEAQTFGRCSWDEHVFLQSELVNSNDHSTPCSASPVNVWFTTFYTAGWVFQPAWTILFWLYLLLKITSELPVTEISAQTMLRVHSSNLKGMGLKITHVVNQKKILIYAGFFKTCSVLQRIQSSCLLNVIKTGVKATKKLLTLKQILS